LNKKLFISFIFLLILASASFIGCEDNNNGSSQTVIIENNFVDDASLSADPETHNVIKFLEHPDSTDQQSDTGEIGNDVIPLNYKQTINHTYCWDDDDQDAEHFMTIIDSEGMEILRLGANEECITALIEAGSYEMVIHHDGKIEETLPIFIVPESTLMAKNQEVKYEGILERADKFLSHIFLKYDMGFTETTMAQTAPSITTILNTLMCVGCNLSGTDLSNLNFSSVNFFTANMTNTNLINTNLSGAILTNVIFTDANLTNANLTSATLSNALWTDGTCRCAIENSVGTCLGCPPCPCNFNAVPITTACWGGQGISTFTSLSTGGCGLDNGISAATGNQTQTMLVMASPAGDTCQIIVRDSSCAQGVSNIPFISLEELDTCTAEIETYITQLNSSGITAVDLPPFNCTP